MIRVWHRVQLSTGVLFYFDCSLGTTPESPDWAGIHYLGQAGLEPVSTLLLSFQGLDFRCVLPRLMGCSI